MGGREMKVTWAAASQAGRWYDGYPLADFHHVLWALCTAHLMMYTANMTHPLFGHCVVQFEITALYLASSNGHTEVVAALLAAGAAVDARDEVCGGGTGGIIALG